MRLILSIFLAYLLGGIFHVSEDLRGDSIDRPYWAWNPTLGKALLVGAIWFIRPILESIRRTGQAARGFVFGLLDVSIRLIIITLFIWGCLTVAAYLFDSILLRVVTIAVLMLIGSAIILPLIRILMILPTIIIALPLDILFPLKETIDVQNISWCRTCKHYRKSKEYENTFSGLWRSDTMPERYKLPCNIPLEAETVWQGHFSSKPDLRTLFPKDCPFFEKRT